MYKVNVNVNTDCDNSNTEISQSKQIYYIHKK